MGRNDDAIQELDAVLESINAAFDSNGTVMQQIRVDIADGGVDILKEETENDIGVRPWSHSPRWRLSARAFPTKGPHGGNALVENCWAAPEVSVKQIRFTNAHPVALWLDRGTRDHGPVNGPWLFIPLTKRVEEAYLSGERLKGLKFGEDFILTKHVKGIEGSGYIKKARKRIVHLMHEIMQTHIKNMKQKLKGRGRR